MSASISAALVRALANGRKKAIQSHLGALLSDLEQDIAEGGDGDSLPVGGVTGQVLAKASNAAQDVEWASVALRAQSITLDNDEILALDSVPQIVVPAQGAGTVIVPVLAIYAANCPVAITGGNNLVLALDATNNYNQVTNGIVAGTLLQAGVAAIAVDASPALKTHPTALDADAYALSYVFGHVANGFEDADLYVSLQSGSFGGGDPANTLKVTAVYAVIDLT